MYQIDKLLNLKYIHARNMKVLGKKTKYSISLNWCYIYIYICVVCVYLCVCVCTHIHIHRLHHLLSFQFPQNRVKNFFLSIYLSIYSHCSYPSVPLSFPGDICHLHLVGVIMLIPWFLEVFLLGNASFITWCLRHFKMRNANR